jgi:hypothetical protein
LNRTLNIRSNVPVRNASGQAVIREDGSIVRRENPELLAIKLKAAQYVTERLAPEHWSKKTEVHGKHLVFSLADLRKAKQEMNRTEIEPK